MAPLGKPGFTYTVCAFIYVDNLLKINEKIQKLEKTGDSRYIYHNELVKACFQAVMG